RADAMKLIRPANSMQDLAGVDLAIEAATEDETIKRKIFAQLCQQECETTSHFGNASASPAHPKAVQLPIKGFSTRMGHFRHIR
ncbi:3-hydroxyacyl-CoA dehydrogenase NAD-binding domain-containing protein, partial [Brucella melitensis]|uniref:3-hydroxyacyl-CoA dehydrogenase NAD-binding domain-containing protein n=1 Tax=Brucella melitensis TaxID=29459 RepID=UPI001FD2145C